MRFKSSVLLTISAALTLSSCGSGSKDVSSTTGWAYNNPKYGGFEYRSGYEQERGPGLAFIEGGTFIMGQVEEDVMREWAAHSSFLSIE